MCSYYRARAIPSGLFARPPQGSQKSGMEWIYVKLFCQHNLRLPDLA